MQDVLQYLTSATLGHPLRSSFFQIFNTKDFLLRSVDRNWDRSARHGVGKNKGATKGNSARQSQDKYAKGL